MRNVTITLAERVAAWARVRAAPRDESLSRYLAGLLRAQRGPTPRNPRGTSLHPAQ